MKYNISFEIFICFNEIFESISTNIVGKTCENEVHIGELSWCLFFLFYNYPIKRMHY